MRLHILSAIAAFAATASCITITLPTDGACIDLTRNLLVEWTATQQEVENMPMISFRLANYRGAFPTINEALPLGVGRTESTRKGYTLLPGMSFEDAQRFYETNNGKGFTVRITKPPTSHTLATEDLEAEAAFMVARPGGGC